MPPGRGRVRRLGGGARRHARRGGTPGRRPTPSAAPDPEGTTVVFQHVGGDANNGRVAVARVDAPRRRTFTGLTCERVYAAAGRGLCLIGEQGLTGPAYKALIFNSAFEVQDELKVQGLLSRARVSPDGRYGATTGFVTGHSYAESDEFSTLTTIIDMQRARPSATSRTSRRARRPPHPLGRPQLLGRHSNT